MSKFNIGRVPSGCGILNFHEFGQYSTYNPKTLDLPKIKITFLSAGWGIATFRELIDKKMYESMKERFPIVYQSPVRLNKNSDNLFFFCIFDLGE